MEANRFNQILIVDDDEVNNLFCSIVIEHAGISDEVHSCLNAPDAFEYIASCLNSGEPVPDLILLDINMPEMSGLEFLAHYHALGYDKKLDTKIAMLSSSFLASDMQAACSYESVVDYIVKPLSESALQQLLRKLAPNLLR